MEKWQLQSAVKVDNVDQLLSILLNNRQIKAADRDEFLQPPSPYDWSLTALGFKLSQFKKISKRLKQAQVHQEKVVIFGDYDADGVCATAIMWEGLAALGISSQPFIPNRQKHGYGLSIKAVKDLIAEQGKPDLLITVDNGIVALEALNFLQAEGVEVIVTDHHQADQSELPILALFHSTKVCGAAVAWFLIRFLQETWSDHQLTIDQLNDLLALAAIATVTDLMPLVGVNRSLLSHGLHFLRLSQRLGIKALCQLTNLKQSQLAAYHLGYVIGPRINAMGRLADSMEALRLLCTHNAQRAKQLAQLLQDTNSQRQDLSQNSIDQADQDLEQMIKEEEILIIAGHYHQGVIGLLAGNLAEKYSKPSIVLALPESDTDSTAVVKASARSLPGFNITKFLRQVADELIDVGGHPMAAGFSLTMSHLTSVKERLLLLSKQQLATVDFQRLLKIDCLLPNQLLNLETASALEVLAPYGPANPQPLFLIKNLLLHHWRAFGRDQQHLKLYFTTQNKQELEVLAWRATERWPDLLANQLYDLAIHIKTDSWRGQSRLQISLRSIKVSA